MPRRALTLLALGALLAGPTALAFYSGGFFDEPRLIATGVAWGLVLLAALTSPFPLPSSTPGRAAVAGLALLCAWAGLSFAWAPLGSAAADDVQRSLLYLGALLAAAALLRDRARLRAVEPVLALGAVAVIGYGLAGRLLPAALDYAASARADGRLEQPITYWNAEGLLAAMGLVLCCRLAGDASRPLAIRVLAAASCVPLGAGVYLSLSRGAMAAAAVGLCVLLAVAPSRSQARATGVGLIAAVAAAAASAAFPGVASLEGTPAAREGDGAVVLALLMALTLAAGAGWALIARAEERGRLRGGPLKVARRLPAVAYCAVGLVLIGLVAGGLGERGEARVTAKDRAERLSSFQSRRYDYWRIAAGAFGDHPLRGSGSGSFRVEWLRERPVREAAQDAHSLPLETAAELGLIGLAALALLFGGVGLAARRAFERHPDLAAGALSATTVWVLHATIDWDWELPAVTLPAIVMAGALIAAGEELRPAQ